MSRRLDVAQIEQVLRRGLVSAGASGASVALVLGEESRIFVHGDAEPGMPVTPSTPFHVCSCSKTFTAAVISRLVQDGVTTWDRPVHEVVPEFRFNDPWIDRHCTFRDLATQRVGLSREGIAEWGIQQDLSKEVRLARAQHMAFSAPFRDRFSYSNLGYIALSLAAERLTGRAYPELADELIFTPLSMTDSCSAGFDVTPATGTASPVLPVNGVRTTVRELTGPNSEGSARIHLSGRDAARWLHFLLAGLSGSDAGPLSAQSVRTMAAPSTIVRDTDIRLSPEPGAGCAYGMGLFTTRLQGQPLLRHGGAGRGWRHALALAPSAQAGVMIMASAESPIVDGLALQLLELLAGGISRDWGGVFAEASAAAAAQERHVVDLRFPVTDRTRAASPVIGRFANAVTGEIEVERDGGRLRFTPQDAPDFTATLQPLGGDLFEFEFDEPALAKQPLDPPFRLSVVDTTTLETSYFGRLGAV